MRDKDLVLVARELERRWLLEVEDLTTELAAAVEKHSSRFSMQTSEISASISEFRAKGTAAVHKRIKKMRKLPGVAFVAELPKVSAADLLDRDMQERRPFTKIGQSTTGMRDTLIWEDLLQQVRVNSDSRFVFITNDGGFLDSSGTHSVLHPHLLKDLDDDEYSEASAEAEPTPVHDIGDLSAAERLFPVRSVYEAVTLVKKFAELVSAKEASARDTFSELLAEFEVQGWAHGTMSFYGAPFETDFPLEMESIEAESFEQSSELEITRVSEVQFELTQVVAIQFSASMSKRDWYVVGAEEDLELWDPDFNDHYVQVATQREFEIRAVIRHDSESPYGDIVEVVVAAA